MIKRKNIKNLDIFVEFKKSLRMILSDIKSKKTKNKCVIYNENIKNLENMNFKKKLVFIILSSICELF